MSEREGETVLTYMGVDHTKKRIRIEPIPGSTHWSVMWQWLDGKGEWETAQAVEATSKPRIRAEDGG